MSKASPVKGDVTLPLLHIPMVPPDQLDKELAKSKPILDSMANVTIRKLPVPGAKYRWHLKLETELSNEVTQTKDGERFLLRVYWRPILVEKWTTNILIA